MIKKILFLLLIASSVHAQHVWRTWPNTNSSLGDTLVTGVFAGSPIDTAYLNMTELHSIFGSGGGLANIVETLNSTSPNGTVKVEELKVSGASTSTNNDLSLIPKGTGAFLLATPDGTTTGGDKRGQYAVDLQMSRSSSGDVASGNYSSIGGGLSNGSTATYATVAGGSGNGAAGFASSVAGGSNNVVLSSGAGGSYASILGGSGNSLNGQFSSILGGRNLTLTGSYSTGFYGGSTSSMTVNSDSAIVFGNTNLLLLNNDSVASELRFYAPTNTSTLPGTIKYVGLKAPVVTTSTTYTLPVADGASGNVLKTDGSGALSWTTGGSGGGVSMGMTTVDLDTIKKVIDTANTATLIHVTTKPTTPQWKYIVKSTDLPSSSVVTDYFFFLTMSGKNRDAGGTTRTVDWRVNVNGTDIGGSDANIAVTTATPFWKFLAIRPTVALAVNDTIEVKFWASLADTIDFQKATIYILPRRFQNSTGMISMMIGAAGMLRGVVSGALSGVTYTTGTLGISPVVSFWDAQTNAVAASLSNLLPVTIGQGQYIYYSNSTNGDSSSDITGQNASPINLYSLNSSTNSMLPRYVYKYTFSVN